MTIPKDFDLPRLREAAIVGGISVLGLAFSLAFQGDLSASDVILVLMFCSIYFGVVTAPVYFYGRRGLIGVWCVTFLFGCFIFSAGSVLSETPLRIRAIEKGLRLSVVFIGWSTLTLPLFVATVIWFRRDPLLSVFAVSGILLFWCALLFLALRIVSIAWDVGPPLYSPLLVASVNVIAFVVTATTLTVFMVKHLRRRQIWALPSRRARTRDDLPLLRSYTRYADVKAFDPNTGRLGVEHYPMSMHVNGQFLTIENIVAAIYRHGDQIVLSYDRDIIPIDVHIRATLIPRKGRRWLDVSRAGTHVLSIPIPDPPSGIPGDFDPPDPEDFDFGLFLSNVINDKDRIRRASSVW